MNTIEIEAAKKDLLFSKEDILKSLKEKIEEELAGAKDEQTLLAYNRLKAKIEKKDIPDLHVDWDRDVIHCYVFFADEFNFVECDVKDFWFSYDNCSHELFMEAFTSENVKEIV